MNKKGIYLYRSVELVIRTRILTGQYDPGQKLPTAHELAEEFDVSKITITSALANLQREGLVWGKQGKGIFVSDSIAVTKQLVVSGSLNKILQDAERYQVKAFQPDVVGMGDVHFSKDIQRFFGVSSNYRTGRLQRIRLLNDVPIYFIENTLSPELSKEITKNELQKMPLLKIFKKKFNISPARGEMYIQSISAESDIAKLLQIETYDPIMHIQVYYWKSSGEPLESANSFMRADYFKYKIELEKCDME